MPSEADVERWADLMAGWQLATGVLNLNCLFSGCLIGFFIGAATGLRAIHAVSLLLPITYTLRLPVEATLILLLATYYAAEFSHQPSDHKRSEPQQRPLSNEQAVAGLGSFLGGLAATIGLLSLVFLFQQIALRFGPAESFALVVFAFASLSVRAGRYPLRTLVSTILGVMIATIGIDSTTGVLRFTLGQPQLYDGIEFSTVVVGLFVVSTIFALLTAPPAPASSPASADATRLSWKEVFSCRWTIFRSSLCGFLVGLLPGAGATIASSWSVQIEKRLTASKLPGRTRELQELAAAEAANSSAVGGAMVPLLALGIPGSGTTAILLGALLLHNITPGPGVFTQYAALIWALALSMLLGHILLLTLYWPLTKAMKRMPAAPDWFLLPAVVCLAFIGVYSVNQSLLSLLVMLLLGVFAYLLERHHYPLVPLLLGFVLGELMENNLRRALAISGGDLNILYSGTASKVLWGLSIIVVLLSLLLSRVQRPQTQMSSNSKTE